MTTSTLSTEEVLELAHELAGNWSRFDSFVWFRRDEVEHAENWAVVYTHHRESKLLEQSNAGVIGKAMMPFTDGDDPDVVIESHSHWAVGWIAGFSIRCLDHFGKPTRAFERYAELRQSMEDYPILDEDDYSEREDEATAKNIVDAAWRLKDEFDLPQNWQYDAHGWLSDHECSEVENIDDQGGYPSEESLRRAFFALGFEQVKAN